MQKVYLTKAQRLQFALPENLKSILVGLILGDLYAQKQKIGSNVRFRFEQSTIHEDYLLHLYDLFKSFSMQAPKVYTSLPHKLTGKIYSRILFNTYSLPCFNDLYNLFYVDGKKIIPSNIGDLLTPVGLAYLICDDGTFVKKDKGVVLYTNCFSLDEVKLLVSVLTDKFKLNCSINKNRGNYVIRISSKSLPDLQNLLKNIMPPMMLHKIGL